MRLGFRMPELIIERPGLLRCLDLRLPRYLGLGLCPWLGLGLRMRPRRRDRLMRGLCRRHALVRVSNLLGSYMYRLMRGLCRRCGHRSASHQERRCQKRSKNLLQSTHLLSQQDNLLNVTGPPKVRLPPLFPCLASRGAFPDEGAGDDQALDPAASPS